MPSELGWICIHLEVDTYPPWDLGRVDTVDTKVDIQNA